MTRSRSTTPRSAAPTRLAEVYTWQPATREHRTVTRRRLPFAGDVRDLVRRAADLVPLIPWRVTVAFMPKRAHLELAFGQDAHGVQTHVAVTLRAHDGAVFAHFARDRSVHGVLFVDLPDDDEGEALTHPRVSVAKLARMPATIGAA